LRSIGLTVSAPEFLSDALNAAAKTINHYMDYTGRRPMPPIDATQLLRRSVPRTTTGT
jgi:hypothetical protein